LKRDVNIESKINEARVGYEYGVPRICVDRYYYPAGYYEKLESEGFSYEHSKKKRNYSN